MAVYAGFLSGGSQIGPVIAGYLIAAQGWRWFFILCAILAAVNLACTLFMLPETIYEPQAEDEPAAEDIEKDNHSHVDAVRTPSQAEKRAQMDYGAYGKGLISFSITKGAKEMGVAKYIAYLFMLPLPMLLVPGVLIASAMYGVILGG